MAVGQFLKRVSLGVVLFWLKHVEHRWRWLNANFRGTLQGAQVDIPTIRALPVQVSLGLAYLDVQTR